MEAMRAITSRCGNRLPGAPLRNMVKGCNYEGQFDSGWVAGCPPPSLLGASAFGIESSSLAHHVSVQRDTAVRSDSRILRVTFAALTAWMPTKFETVERRLWVRIVE